MTQDERNYQEFFKEELYDGFVRFLLNKYGSATIIEIVDDESIITKKGVHHLLKRQFNEFLNRNPRIEKRFVEERGRCLNLRNVSGGALRFPVDAKDDKLMGKLNFRPHEIIPMQESVPRASARIKASAAPMTGQVFKDNWHEKLYLSPRKLTVYFKRGYANAIRKSTMTFWVSSRSEAMDILINRYKNKVAFADILNTESFEFVKRIRKPRKAKDVKLKRTDMYGNDM
jgi:hypothetical protein